MAYFEWSAGVPRRKTARVLGLVLAGVLLAALAGLMLARRMTGPIQRLQEGAARIGGGDLSKRIEIKTGGELEVLAGDFNRMAARLQESYTGLEHKVEHEFPEEFAEAWPRWVAADAERLHGPGILVADCSICHEIAATKGLNLEGPEVA